MRKAAPYFRKHRIKISILAAVLIFLVAGASLYVYYQGEEERKIINIMKEKGMWNPNLTYERFVSADVDTLPRPWGFWAYKSVNVTYYFYHYTGYPLEFALCLTPTSKNTVFLVITNNVTVPARGNSFNPDWRVLTPPRTDTPPPNCGSVFWLENRNYHIHISYHIYLYSIDNSKFVR
jgi:uncharacterized protein YcfL